MYASPDFFSLKKHDKYVLKKNFQLLYDLYLRIVRLRFFAQSSLECSDTIDAIVISGVCMCFFTADNDDVLEKVREKLVNIESDDPQQRAPPRNESQAAAVQPESLHRPPPPNEQPQPQEDRLHRGQHHQHHVHHQQKRHAHGTHHFRRPSRSDETRDVAVLRKWKISKAFAPRRPSTESESESDDDRSERALPEIRVVNAAACADEPNDNGKTDAQPPPPPQAGTGLAGRETSGGAGRPAAVDGADAGGQPVKHNKARLKLAQILYKEARRRKQKYLEELQSNKE